MIFPPNCAGCGKWGSKYCGDCTKKTKIIQSPFCTICGQPDISLSADVCALCRSQKIHYQAARAWGIYEPPLSEAIHRLKYRNDIGLADEFAGHLLIKLTTLKWNIELVTAVPLEKQRLKDRGYNQSEFLARRLAKRAGLDYVGSVVTRKRSTLSQVGLTREQRVRNVQGAFSADKGAVTNKSILIVDDVITTGATMNSCSESLLQAGAREVYALTVARSIHL